MVLQNTMVLKNYEVFGCNKSCSFETKASPKLLFFWSFRNCTRDLFFLNHVIAHLWFLKLVCQYHSF
uniref:Uncharacterized protein n=1 Tax=Arundo donax TaxID=35708 RepID=A0A0A8YXE1_ARUDO